MARIPQAPLFSWEEIEEIGDLSRLRLLLENLPDERLMRTLEKHRGQGRDDYPVRPVWNSILAGIVFQHGSVESLRRELKRNGQLRWVCGFDIGKGSRGVPPSHVYSRFLRLLFAHGDFVEAMFAELVAELQQLLPDFGKVLALDGKAIDSHGRSRSAKADPRRDGRRDIDANWGVKTYKGKRADGTSWKKTKAWFGYKLHLIADATYELPIAYELTVASAAEQPAGQAMVRDLSKNHPELMESCRYLTADKGYDDGGLIRDLWDAHQVKAVVDIRDLWKGGEKERIVPGSQNVVYDHRGKVYCYCMETGSRQEMAYGGFEKDRNRLKYRCPARHYGMKCSSLGSCDVSHSLRIPLEEDRRVFTPLARSSYRWQKIYKKRTAVERVNGRLDTSFGFEEHYIRGRQKMKLRVGLSLLVMLAMAAGRIKQKRPELMRSLVGDAA